MDSAALLDRLRIPDTPRFARRGLPRCRPHFPRRGDGSPGHRPAVAHKLNVLHLHLTDDQGWRVEVPGWPLLTGIGGAGARGDRPGDHYSTEDVSSLVQYADERFATLTPEIDMPGHASAVSRSYPTRHTPSSSNAPSTPSWGATLREFVTRSDVCRTGGASGSCPKMIRPQ
ncbi:family 20 glycosylhydrolase [Streptomyces anulatus]